VKESVKMMLLLIKLLISLMLLKTKVLSRHRWRVAHVTQQEPPTVNNEPRNNTDDGMDKATNCYCGLSSEGDSDRRRFRSRIVGGGEISEGEIPWQAALVENGDLGKLLCGAVLVSSRKLLTAAHCVKNQPIASLAVALGFNDLTQAIGKGRYIIMVSNANIHPDYKGSATYHQADIALLTLAKEVNIAKEAWIKPVCLPSIGQNTQSEGRYDGRPGMVSGWGLTSFFFGTFPTKLQQTDVTILGTICGELSHHLQEGQLCAGGDGRDACQGDSGGPLVIQENGAATLVGLVSAGSRCGSEGVPGIYTDISFYWHWIVEQLEEGEECPHPARREPSGPGSENPIIHEEKKPGKTENSSFASSDEAQTVLNYIAPTLDKTTTTTTTKSTRTTSSKTTSTTTTMAALSEVVLLIGGDGFARGTGVEVWGPSCTHLLPPLPFSRHGAEAVQKRGEVVLCGGGMFGPNCLSLSKSLHWKPFTGRGWTPVTHTRACLASLEQGMVMHTGGPDNTAWLWHPGVGEGWWERIADLPRRLYAHACTYLPQEGRVLIAGGSDGFELRRETYSYQLASGHWKRGPDLHQPRWWANMVVMDGVVTILGGGNGSKFLPDVEQLQNRKWHLVDLPLLQPRSNFAAVVLQKDLIQEKFKQLDAACTADSMAYVNVP